MSGRTPVRQTGPSLTSYADGKSLANSEGGLGTAFKFGSLWLHRITAEHYSEAKDRSDSNGNCQITTLIASNISCQQNRISNCCCLIDGARRSVLSVGRVHTMYIEGITNPIFKRYILRTCNELAGVGIGSLGDRH